MATHRITQLSAWLSLLIQIVRAQAQDQAPLPAEPDIGLPALKLVAYVTPSTEVAKALEPEWTAAKSSATDFPMEWIDSCPNDTRFPDNLPYPAIKLYRDETPVAEYNGPRTSEEILHFISRAQKSSHVPTKLTPDEAESFKTIDSFVCIAHLPPSGKSLREAFEAVAETHWTEFTFGIVDDLEGEAKVVCHKRDDESAHTWTSGAEGLGSWILETSRPVISELSLANHQRLLDRGWPMIYIFHPDSSTRATLRSQLHSFAKKQYTSLTCITADPAYFPDLPARLGLDPARDGWPAGAVHQVSNGRIYPYPKGRGFTPGELQGWGLDVWQGRVKPWTPPGQESVEAENVGGGNMRIVGRHNLKVKNILGLKIKIGGRERDEL